jgi:HK97 family phage portal protein
LEDDYVYRKYNYYMEGCDMNVWDTMMSIVHRQRDIVVASHMQEDDRSKKATLTDASWVSAPMYGSPRKIDFSELEEYEYDITVQAAVNFIVDSVATCEWDIVPDDDLVDDEEPQDATEAIKFFNGADWEESFSTVRRGVVADTLLYDSGVLVVTFPEFCYDENKSLIKDGVAPLQLRARDGRSFIKQVSRHGDILKFWQYSFLNQAAKPVEFNTTEIIYVQERPSTRSPYGTSKLEVVKNVADLMMAVQNGHRAENENALQIGGVINHPDVTDAERLRALSAMYNSKLKGEHNKNAWLVTGGNVEINPINANVSDDSWIPGSEFYQQQILSLFKVPKTVLGITSADTNRSTAMAQSVNFKRFGVSTMLSLIEGIFTREIVKRYFGDRLMFRFVREIDLADESIRADIDAVQIANGTRTVNELRARDGLEEIEEPEEDDEGYEFGDEYGEFESLDGLTPDESAEIGKSFGFEKTLVHVPASGGRAAYDYERVGAQEQHTDVLLTGIESVMAKREAMMQAGDKLDGIEIGKQRRATKASGRSILMAMEAKRPPPQADYTAGMKELLDRGDIEKKAGKGYKMTKQGKARIKAINELVLRSVENVPFRPDDVNKAHGKGLDAIFGKTLVHVPASGGRVAYDYERADGKGDDKATDLKAKACMFNDLGNALKKELKSLVDKFTTAGITPEGKQKIDVIKNKMDTAYKNRDAAIAAWEKHTGKKWDRKPTKKPGDGKKKPAGDKKERKPQSEEAKAKAAETRRLREDVVKYQAEGDALKKDVSAAEKKYTSDGKMSVDGKKKVDALTEKMDAAYKQRDDAKKELKGVESGTTSVFKEGKNSFKGMSRIEIDQALKDGGWDLSKGRLFTPDDPPASNTDFMVKDGKIYGIYGSFVNKDTQLYIGLIEVNPGMTGQGYGKTIMGDIIKDGLDKGCDNVVLSSMDSQSDKFYGAIGMEISVETDLEEGGNGYRGDKGWMNAFIKSI